jgi:hypothetical protein
MVSVISIDQFTLKDNPCYACVPACEEITLSYVHPNGIEEYTDYIAYSLDNVTLIAFNDLPNASDPYSLNITTNTGEEYIIQFNLYERDMNELNNSVNKPHQFFSFLKPVHVKSESIIGLVSLDERCDIDKYGPRVYDVSDGISEAPMDYSMMAGNLKDFRVIYSINGVGYISVQEVWPIAMQWRNWPIVTGVSKTFSGMIKLISEWKTLHDSNLSTEEIAEGAASFLNLAGFSESMLNELNETEVMMPVARFINGHADARHGFSETGILPNSILQMIKDQSRYETLTSLEINHPLHPQIPQWVKAEEKKKMDNFLLKYVLISMPQTDPEDVTIDQISESLDFFNNGQPDIKDTKTFINAIKAKRYYDAITE